MSTYFATSSGNFTDSTVFARTISTADKTDNISSVSVGQNTIINAPFVSPIDDTISAVAVHLSARNTSPTGTLTIDLQSSNGAHVTENYPISSFTSFDGSNNLLTVYPQNWQLLQLSSPMSVAAADTITLSVSASNNDQISLIGSAGGYNLAKNTSVKVGTEPGYYTAATPFSTGISELSFDLRSANSNWLYHPYSSDFGFNSSEDFTVEGYFYFKTIAPTCHSILNFGRGWNGGGWSSAWGIHYRTDNQNIYFYRYYEGVMEAYYNCVAPLTVGRWTHIAITRENGTLAIWIDGALMGIQTGNTVDYSGLPAPHDKLQIGYGASCSAEQYEDMYVSNVRVTKSAVYTITGTPAFAPLASVSDTAFLYNSTHTHNYTTSDSSNNTTSKEFNLQAKFYNSIGNYEILKTGSNDRSLSTSTPFNTVGMYSHYFDGGTYANYTNTTGLVPPSNYGAVNSVTSLAVDSHSTVLGLANGKLCAEFNGTDNSRYITVPGANLAFNTEDFTIECFIYPRAHTAAYPCIFRTRPNNTSDNNILLFAGHSSFNTSKYQLALAGSTPYISSTSDIVYNTWTHIAAVRKSGVLYLYVNGVQESSMPYTTDITSTVDWNIGADSTQGNFMFNGYIADFRVTKSALYSAATETTPSYPLSTTLDTAALVNIKNIGAYNIFSLTLDTWVKVPSTTSSANRTIAVSTITNSTDGWHLYITPTGTVAIKMLSDNTIITSTTILQPDRWYFISFVGDTGDYKLYIDGIQEGATYTGILSLRSRHIVLGARASTQFLTGYLYDFRAIDGTAISSITIPTTERLVSDCPLSVDYYKTVNSTGIPGIAGPSTTGDTTSLVFNGVDQYVESLQSLPYISSDTTIEFWFYRTTTTTSYQMLIDARSEGRVSTAFAIDINRHNDQHLEMYEHNGNYGQSISKVSVTSNEWHHVVVQRKNGVIYTYYDGTLTNVITSSDTDWFGGTVMIGKTKDSNSYYYQGYISNVRISSIARYNSSTITLPGHFVADEYTLFLAAEPYNNIYNFSSTLLKAYSPIAGKVTLPFTWDTPFADGVSDSLFFEGAASEGIALAASNDYKLGVSKTPFTIELWTYLLTNDSSRYLVVGNNTGGDGWGNMAFVLFTQSDYFYWQAHTSAGYGHTIVHDTIRPSSRINKWTHWVVQYDGRYTRMFINGAPSGQVIDLGSGEYQSALYDGKLCIGRSLDGTAYKIHGLISNYRIVNGTAIYPDIGFIPPTSKLTNVAGTVLFAQAPYSFPFSTKTLTPPAPPANTNSTDMLFFNGNTYLKTADPLTSISGDATIEFWVYLLRSNKNEYFFDERPGAVATPWLVGRSPGDILRMAFIPADTSAGALAAKTWNYVNITRKNNTTIMSINGNVVNIVSNTTTDWGGNILLLGRIWNDGYNMIGYLSNIRITKSASANVPGFTPSTSPLTVLPNTTFLLKTGADLDKYIISTDVRSLTAFDPISIDASTYTPLTSASNRSITEPDYFKLGANNWIVFDHHDDFNFYNTEFTLEAWAYISNAGYSGENGADGNFRLFAKMNCACWAGNFQLFINGSNKVCLWYGEWCNSSISTAIVPTNQWFHIAFVGNSSRIQVYINGTLSYTFNYPIFANNTQPFIIGNENCGDYAHGYISNARVIKNKMQYTSNFTPDKQLTATPETVLLLQSPYNVYDGNTYTSYRADATSVINPNTGSPAYTFNGTSSRIRIHPKPLFNEMYGNEFTFEAWVKPAGTGASRVIMTRRMYGGNYPISWYVYLDSSNLLNIHNYFSVQTNQTPIPNDTWSHIALVCDKTYVYLFINGAFNYRYSNLPPKHNQIYYYPITIGYGAYSTEYFQGSISDIRFVVNQMMYLPQTVPSVPTVPLGLDGSGYTSLLFTDPYNEPNRIYNTSSGDVAFIVDSTYNADTISASNPAADTPFTDGMGNPVGNSVYFYGGLESKNTYMRSVELPAMGLDVDNGEFTVEFWFKDTHTTSVQQCLFDNRQVGNWNLLIDLNAIRTRSIRARLNNIDIVSDANTYDLNTWNHVAVVRFNRSTFALYINGNLSASATVTVTPTSAAITAAEMWIGQYNNDQGHYFRGYMSNIRIVKNRAVYATRFPVPTTAPADVLGKTPLLLTTSLYNPQKTYEYYPPSSNILVPGSPFTSVGVDGPLSFVHDRITIPHTQELNLYGVEWTMETWIYPYFPNGTWRCICIKHTTTGGQWRSYSLYLHPDSNRIHFGTYNGGQGDAVAPLSTELYPNIWSHVALVCDGTITKLFVNGKHVHTYSFAPTEDNSNQTLEIGRENGPTGAASFEGYLSNFRIVRGKQIYTSDFTPSTTPLDAIPYTSLLLKNPYTPLSYTAYATPTNIHISSRLVGDTTTPIIVNVAENQIVNNLWVHNKATLNMPINNNITLDVIGMSGLHVTSEGTFNIT